MSLANPFHVKAPWYFRHEYNEIFFPFCLGSHCMLTTTVAFIPTPNSLASKQCFCFIVYTGISRIPCFICGTNSLAFPYLAEKEAMRYVLWQHEPWHKMMDGSCLPTVGSHHKGVEAPLPKKKKRKAKYTAQSIRWIAFWKRRSQNAGKMERGTEMNTQLTAPKIWSRNTDHKIWEFELVLPERWEKVIQGLKKTTTMWFWGRLKFRKGRWEGR